MHRGNLDFSESHSVAGKFASVGLENFNELAGKNFGAGYSY